MAYEERLFARATHNSLRASFRHARAAGGAWRFHSAQRHVQVDQDAVRMHSYLPAWRALIGKVLRKLCVEVRTYD